MVEPVTTALAGIALVTKSVEFIKSNIQTAQDIGQFVGAIENAFEGEKQCIKARAVSYTHLTLPTNREV